MPPIYDTTVKTARMTATRDSVANGTLEILSAANVVLATFGLDADGGSVSGDVWSLELDAATVAGEDAAGAGTTATKGRIKNSGGTVRVTGLTVGDPASSADIKLINTSISDGQDVTINSAQIQHAPDPA
ncbi:hypothetical protein DEM27_00185 [Metarhizobium album]|uniref:Uncharacterized protein n=1 Tax=Metarhizobium album TaxID=2182425 RepID=A0A2U2DWH5_9HYPH|nr:hypothetical protein [Rhizobium album]PWE57667.1 hypothetical protein DEM27_00185 [Rhizobium album]